MSDTLQRPTVLVLNRHWQAIHVKTPAEAFSMMATGSASALNMADGSFRPTSWSEWIALPVAEGDAVVRTVRGPVRVPTVVVLARYDRVPRKRLPFGLRGLWERDGGICQYTGRQLTPGEGNIDHVQPVGRGGETSWENCVLASKAVNQRKGCRTPSEAGLKLLRKPVAPRELPVTYLIKNTQGVADWEVFLPRR
jgi:5-methylcytosine-specific restriction endonuclease McrA